MKTKPNISTKLRNFNDTGKTIYVLVNPLEPSDQLAESLITWVYHFADHHIITPSLEDLLATYYNQN